MSNLSRRDLVLYISREREGKKREAASFPPPPLLKGSLPLYLAPLKPDKVINGEEEEEEEEGEGRRRKKGAQGRNDDGGGKERERKEKRSFGWLRKVPLL